MVMKRILVMFGVGLLIISFLSKALDTEGNTLTNKIKVIYGTSISASHLSNPHTEFEQWNELMRYDVASYVVENSSIAGIKDSLLIDSLKQLIEDSNKLTTQLSTVRAGLILKGQDQVHPLILKKCAADLNSIKNAVNTTITKLKAEKYYITSKKNAQEVLLLALDRVKMTIDKAIELLVVEIQQR
jgi:hypothetical protein